MMTPVLLQATGELLFGSAWQAHVSRELPVHERTLRRWLSGAERIPSAVAMDLRRLCEERRLQLADAIERLRVAATPP